jgi:hypothetical protein
MQPQCIKHEDEGSRRGLSFDIRRHRPQLWRRVHRGGIYYTGSSRPRIWCVFPEFAFLSALTKQFRRLPSRR